MKKVYSDTDDGSAIAKALGTTRQNVSQTLKRAMKKYFLKLQELEPQMDPFELALTMMKMLQVSETKEVAKFYSLFPKDIKDLIENDVREKRSAGMPLYESMQDIM